MPLFTLACPDDSDHYRDLPPSQNKRSQAREVAQERFSGARNFRYTECIDGNRKE
ncbi:MAG: hypothetical protein ABIO81_13215 [Ginsengibacter sp.]